jgi:spermidine synthase
LNSGAGIAFRYQNSVRARKVGVIGLGSGALAAYARAGDLIRFYEIDAEVARIANSHFSYLKDSDARVEILLGDARIALEREEPQDFDMLFVDAFSSDSIPVHLLTREAFEIYDRQLNRNGVLAVHISSAHLDLEPPVRRLAQHLQMNALRIDSHEDGVRGIEGAVWMLLSRDERWLKKVSKLAHPSIATWAAPSGPLWTDDYANILGALTLAWD